MKKSLSRIIPVFIVFWIFVYNPVISPSAENADQRNATDKKSETVAAKVGYLENVLFEKLPGKERINLVVSQQPVINVSTQADGSLLVKLENMFAPDNLRGSLGEGSLVNIVRVKPMQQLLDGKQFIYLTIDLKENVPYAIRQEEKNIFIDFNISSLVKKKPVESLVVKGKNKKAAAKKKDVGKISEETATVSDDVQENETKPAKKIISKRKTDRLITLDFQDADIKTVLRLMAEYGNTNIVSGDDVKGKVTLTIKNVPWEQALDSILDINGLTKKQMGDVISVMTLERKKKDEGDKVKAEEDQIKAEDQRKERELKVLVEKGKLRQILIEVKIVEATEDWIRKLGVTWGFGKTSSIGSYGLGLSAGTSTLQTNSYQRPYPSQITPTADSSGNLLTQTMAAVNLPAALASPTLGLVFGAGSSFIEAQLSALESTTTGRVISAPKVVTMDNVKAVIKQGVDVPYVTPASGNSAATVTFKEAVLKLEVKPKITDEGRISMEIKANKDTPDYATGLTLQGNPPINKNEIESKVVVQDGDTVVIGGVSVTQEDKVVSGVPWLQKIPVLGWLFKTENIENQKKQLLIFITPKILTGAGYIEDECSVGNIDADRCRSVKK
jgi:type IV pilus assembly protein PilQ